MRVTRFFCCALSAFLVFLLVGQSKAVELVGYLPDYRMGGGAWQPAYVNNILPKQLPLLDEVRYFGIETDSNGNLIPGCSMTMAGHIANINTIKAKISALPANQRPRLNITLGGWGKSTGFAPVASDATKRQALANNIKAFLNTHQLNGVDLDWEHPNTDAELKTHYPALISKIKQTLGSNLLVSAAVAPSKILPHSVFEGPNAIDSVALMTYDLSWWSSDGRGPHSPQQYAEDAVTAWTGPNGEAITVQPKVFGGKTSVDAPEDRLGVGFPMYGRGIDPTYTWAKIYSEIHAGTTTDGNVYTMSNGDKFWITGPDLVAERIEWANQQGIHEVIMWELFQDLSPDHSDSLLLAAYNANQEVPEPTSFLLVIMGLLSLAFCGLRRKFRQAS